MHSRHTIHRPSGSPSNQVQPEPEQAGHLSFSGMARSLCGTTQSVHAQRVRVPAASAVGD